MKYLRTENFIFYEIIKNYDLIFSPKFGNFDFEIIKSIIGKFLVY